MLTLDCYKLGYRLNNALLKNIYAIIPRTFEFVTLQGKRDFADVIKVTDLKLRRWLWMFLAELNLIT